MPSWRSALLAVPWAAATLEMVKPAAVINGARYLNFTVTSVVGLRSARAQPEVSPVSRDGTIARLE